MRFKRGDEGFKVSKVSRQFGDMYCSDIRPLGMTALKRRYDQETGKVETIQRGVSHYGKNAQGEYVLTKREGLGFRAEYERGQDGKDRKVRSEGLGISARYSYGEDGTKRIDKIKWNGGNTAYRSEAKKAGKKENDQ